MQAMNKIQTPQSQASVNNGTQGLAREPLFRDAKVVDDSGREVKLYRNAIPTAHTDSDALDREAMVEKANRLATSPLFSSAKVTDISGASLKVFIKQNL